MPLSATVGAVTTLFDPAAGVLRIRHAALAVLARLATAPTDIRLHDHDIAPLVAEFRGAGLLGAAGIHPDVAPLAQAIGSAHTVGDVTATNHGTLMGARLWVAGDLLVVGVATTVPPHTYELMADEPRAGELLLSDLVGLGSAPEPPDGVGRELALEAFDGLVAADAAVEPEDVARALGPDADGAWARALADGLRGSPVRWRLIAHRDGGRLLDMEVLDAGASGLWLAERGDGTAVVAQVTPRAVRERFATLLHE